MSAIPIRARTCSLKSEMSMVGRQDSRIQQHRQFLHLHSHVGHVSGMLSSTHYTLDQTTVTPFSPFVAYHILWNHHGHTVLPQEADESC